jgi:hypothetical protein
MSDSSDVQRIDSALLSAVEYLGRIQIDSGEYLFVVNSETGQVVKTQYGITRHIGTLFSLSRCMRVGIDCETTFVRGLEYAKKQYVREVIFPSGSKSMAVINQSTKKATLNGTALLACAIGERLLSGKDEDFDLFKSLLSTIGEMQRGDGIFYQSYDQGLEMFDTPFDVCSSGEACLALTYGISLLGKQPWLSMSVTGLSGLVSTRPFYVAKPYVESFWWSWFALALERMYPITLEPATEGMRQFVIPQQFIYHVVNVCEQALVSNKEVAFHDQMNMSIASSNLTTIWSTYRSLTINEVSASDWMVRTCHLPSKLKRWGTIGLLLVCDSQIQDGNLKGGIPFVADGSKNIRIDTVSHFIDAVLSAKIVSFGL